MRQRLIGGIFCLIAVSGCATTRPWNPWAKTTPRIPPGSSKQQVVALLNRNITGDPEEGGGVESWRSTNVSFKIGGIPVPASGQIHVQAPKNFRILVSHPIAGTEELDVGSNHEEFWIWQKEMNPPYILTAHHEDLPLALQYFRVPFQPDWLMEVLGVIPLNPEDLELHWLPDRPQLELAAYRLAPDGSRVRRVIRVDTQRGLITEHILWGPDGRMIANAKLDGYQPDPQTGVMLPRVIRVQWPDAQLDLKMTLKDLEVNPSQLPEFVWTVPQKNGFRTLDMGAWARRQQSGNEIQYAEHEVTPAPRQPIPSLEGALPFPNRLKEAPYAAGVDRALPTRGQFDTLDPPGRVRLGQPEIDP